MNYGSSNSAEIVLSKSIFYVKNRQIFVAFSEYPNFTEHQVIGHQVASPKVAVRLLIADAAGLFPALNPQRPYYYLD